MTFDDKLERLLAVTRGFVHFLSAEFIFSLQHVAVSLCRSEWVAVVAPTIH